MTKLPLHASRSNNIPKISIIGAGISGLALACQLAVSKIPFNIYEARNAQTIGHTYSITLQRSALRSLNSSRYLREAVRELRPKTAVDRAVGGNGRVSDQSPKGSASFQAVDRDVRKWLVELLAKQGGFVNWDHRLTAVRPAAEGSGAELCFENQEPTIADLVIDAGGLGSPCFDYDVEAAPKPRLLPYACYAGRRRMRSHDFLDKYSHYFRDGNTIELAGDIATSTPFISLQKVHLGERDQEGHDIELRWVFSRPSLGGHDPLYRPGRTPEEAKVIPPELYKEMLASVTLFSPKKQSMLQQFFDLLDLHSDRILHWHLRVRLPAQQYFATNADRKTFYAFAMGDAAHSVPILKSNGAVQAFHDARHMAESIVALLDCPGGVGCLRLSSTTKLPFRTGEWLREAEDSIQRLRQVHGQREHTTEELLGILGITLQERDAANLPGKVPSDAGKAASEEKGKL